MAASSSVRNSAARWTTASTPSTAARSESGVVEVTADGGRPGRQVPVVADEGAAVESRLHQARQQPRSDESAGTGE